MTMLRIVQDNALSFIYVLLAALLITEIRIHVTVIPEMHPLLQQMYNNNYDTSIYSRILANILFGHYSFILLALLCVAKVIERMINSTRKQFWTEDGWITGDSFLRIGILLLSILHILTRFISTQGTCPSILVTATCSIPIIISNKRSSILCALYIFFWCASQWLVWDMRSVSMHLISKLFANHGDELAAWISFLEPIRTLEYREFLLVDVLESIPIHYACLKRSLEFNMSNSEIESKEHQLEKQETTIEAIVNCLPALVWIYDTNFVVTFCKGIVLEELGVTEGSCEGLPMREALVHLKLPEDAVESMVEHHKAALRGETVVFLCENPSIPNSVFKCFLIPLKNREGAVTGVVGSAMDIKDLIVAQKAKLDSDENYRLLVETIHELVVRVDTDFQIQFINHDFQGESKTEFFGRSFLDFYAKNPTLQQKVEQNLERLVTARESSSWDWSSSDYAQVDEQEISFFSSSAYVIVKDDQVVGATIITTNTTERVQRQEQQRIVQEARVASKSKSEFISQMSHEIRNPLNAIMGSLELLCLSRDNLTRLQQEHLLDATENAKLLLTIVSDILDLSKIESGKIDITVEPGNILDVVETTAGMFASQVYKQKLKLYTYVDPRIPLYLMCDRNRIAQILMNYASNSAKFTRRGSITLAATLLEQTDREATIRFECIDTGIGIKKSDQARVFEPFVQIISDDHNYFGQTYKGWGLGLQICSRLAKLMNGRVGVQSEIGIGSTFFFEVTLPIASDNPLSGVKNQPIAQFLPEIYFDRIVLLSLPDELSQILVKYMKAMKVKNITIFTCEQQLSDYVRELNTQEKLAIIVSSEFEQLEIVTSMSSTYRKVIIVADNSQEGAIPGKYSLLRLPLKLEKLVTELGIDAVKSSLPPPKCWSSDLSLLIPPEYLRILYVEDNAVNRKVMYFLLSKLGIKNIDFAENGQEGLEKVMNSDHGYSIIFMDLNMPIMDGRTAATKIRELSNHSKASSPIVAVTANAEATSIRSLGPFFGDAIVKPVSIERLVDVINKYSRPSSLS